jgi:hypothetical protein
MSDYQWKLEKEEKPTLYKQVLAWNECQLCRKELPHSHDQITRESPIEGTFIAKYCPPSESDIAGVMHMRSLGDNSWDEYLEPYWRPDIPEYWRYIDRPPE